MKAKSTKSLCQRIMNWLFFSEGDLVLAVRPGVLHNLVSQTKETILHIIMPLHSLRQPNLLSHRSAVVEAIIV